MIWCWNLCTITIYSLEVQRKKVTAHSEQEISIFEKNGGFEFEQAYCEVKLVIFGPEIVSMPGAHHYF